MLLNLVGLLSTNKSVKNAIKGGYPKTDTRQNDVTLILLTSFVL